MPARKKVIRRSESFDNSKSSLKTSPVSEEYLIGRFNQNLSFKNDLSKPEFYSEYHGFAGATVCSGSVEDFLRCNLTQGRSEERTKSFLREEYKLISELTAIIQSPEETSSSLQRDQKENKALEFCSRLKPEINKTDSFGSSNGLILYSPLDTSGNEKISTQWSPQTYPTAIEVPLNTNLPKLTKVRFNFEGSLPESSPEQSTANITLHLEKFRLDIRLKPQTMSPPYFGASPDKHILETKKVDNFELCVSQGISVLPSKSEPVLELDAGKVSHDILQAIDLLKTSMGMIISEEVVRLNLEVKKLADRMSRLSLENRILKEGASRETLSYLNKCNEEKMFYQKV